MQNILIKRDKPSTEQKVTRVLTHGNLTDLALWKKAVITVTGDAEWQGGWEIWGNWVAASMGKEFDLIFYSISG